MSGFGRAIARIRSSVFLHPTPFGAFRRFADWRADCCALITMSRNVAIALFVSSLAFAGSAGARTDVDPWQRLRPEMTKNEVRNSLGAPPWTDRSLLFEFWMYEIPSPLATGVVVFENERVFSWRPPAERR